jgi:ferredoxin
MTGYVISARELSSWCADMMERFTVIGPMLDKRGQAVFKKIDGPERLFLEYRSTMLSPRRFIYPPSRTLVTIERDLNRCVGASADDAARPLLFAVHPCDMQAISVLDGVLLGDYRDPHYEKMRKAAVTVVLNCAKACEKGFCASMGSGPFLKLREGYDIELTRLRSDDGGEGGYLVEHGSRRGKMLVERGSRMKKADKKAFAEKVRLEAEASRSFVRRLDTDGLVDALGRNLDHPVYRRTAEEKCLGCTNCTMVCPTCYCYNVSDETSLDLKRTVRKRQWDSCQELNFARVHGGNFRSSREARLRQFVTHKLCTWVEQYGCFGCVGCGRCMTWCPTGIDLAEMAGEVRRDDKPGTAK